MTEEEYKEMLASAPKNHLTPEFKLFLINNNEVIAINDDWLVIKNIKYWTPENEWLTAFFTGNSYPATANAGKSFESLSELLKDFNSRELLIKGDGRRTVEMWHCHLYKK